MTRGRPLAPRTVLLYRSQLDLHILPTLGSVRLRDLDRLTVREWWARMSSEDGPGPVTAAKCYRLLKTICSSAVEDEQISRNPCEISGAGQEFSPERPFVSVDEVYHLADEIGPRWRALILVAAFCGLRFGELAALRRTRVDLLHTTIEVRESVAELPGGVRLVGRPKSQAGMRTVHIPPAIVGDLEVHLSKYAENSRDGLLFVGPKGGPIRSANFGAQVFRPARDRVGLVDVHFHDLRGTAATLAARAGGTTRELMARLGHATPDAALRYQRATAARDKDLAKRLSEELENRSVALSRDDIG